MTPMQQILLGVGTKKKVYMDEVFSSYAYIGTGSSRSINNGINLSGDGGLTWIKSRTNANGHRLVDTVRGATKYVESESTNIEGTESTGLTAFNNNGFTLGADGKYNYTDYKYASWTFKRAKGFFDVVAYTGNGSDGRTVAHSLGCVPGCILVRRLNANDQSWAGYHRWLNGGVDAEDYRIILNENLTEATSGQWGNTAPTASSFTVDNDNATNGNGNPYIAYIFAGGESTAAAARSVDMDGTGDYLSLAQSSDFDMGTGDYTIECWFKKDSMSTGTGLWTMHNYTSGQEVFVQTDGKIGIYSAGSYIIQSGLKAIHAGQWYHVAVARQSGTVRLFVDGTLIGSASQTGAMPTTNGPFYIGVENSGSNIHQNLNGLISNVRVVKGTAVYTSSFRPLTEPLTNITNTKLLCCNNSSTTGSTVTPGTITANGDPTASSDSPFDDPAGFKFGESKEGIIKCGSYIGNGNADGPEINLGWEPEFILLKDTTSNNSWRIYDSMRGIATGEPDDLIHPNSSAAAYSNGATNEIDLTSTGFKVVINDSGTNSSGSKYVYMTIRRPDGYVQKPVEDATKVFAIATGSGSAYAYTAGFPVDFGWYKAPTQSGSNHWASARLMQGKEFKLNDNVANTSWSGAMFDSSTKWVNATHGSNIQSWMFKRHAGFDVVTYKGNGIAGRQIPHSLNKTIEMMWVKSRDSAGNDADWQVYHKGLGQADNDPEGWNLRLNTNQAENWNNFGRWNKTLPTSTHFTLGNYDGVNKNGDNMIALLFASVDSISKCGFYSGSSSTQTITTGFQPRFLIIKRTTGQDPWFVLDTTRGWGSGNDNWLALDTNQAQNSADLGAPTSTGFTVNSGSDAYNNTGQKYIYYCHA